MRRSDWGRSARGDSIEIERERSGETDAGWSAKRGARGATGAMGVMGESKRASLLAWLAAHFLRALGATWRIRYEGRNPLDVETGAQIGAVWHRDLLMIAYVFRDRGFSVPVSQSRDGDRITGLLLQLGYEPPTRGSTSRGGAGALRGLVRRVHSGVTVAVTVDGPRGPSRRVKIGAISLARLSGIAVTPVVCSARPCLRFGSWDGTLLPLPFARVVVRFGAPVLVAAQCDPATEEELRAQLESTLNTLTDGLDARLQLTDTNRPD